MNSILDPIYNILTTFFPSALYQQPFFNFLINFFIFAFCCWFFSLCFIYPLNMLFKWFKGIIYKC